MHGFGRMQEKRGCAGRRQRGGDLAGDMARFSDSADDATRPRQFSKRVTAWTKLSSRRASNCASACASMRNVRRAEASAASGEVAEGHSWMDFNRRAATCPRRTVDALITSAVGWTTGWYFPARARTAPRLPLPGRYGMLAGSHAAGPPVLSTQVFLPCPRSPPPDSARRLLTPPPASCCWAPGNWARKSSSPFSAWVEVIAGRPLRGRARTAGGPSGAAWFP